MARDILGEYGSESPGEQKPRAKTGGVKKAVDVNAYQPPQGPTSVNNPDAPGLHGTVYKSGSQTSSIKGGESGSPGLHGTNRSGGSQR